MKLLLSFAGEDVTLLSEKEDDSKGNGDVVYSEAVKQLLIEKLPMVLCLHLKRFLHVGRQLRKNSRHVSFPTLMDMRPFCTPGYQVRREQTLHSGAGYNALGNEAAI